MVGFDSFVQGNQWLSGIFGWSPMSFFFHFLEFLSPRRTKNSCHKSSQKEFKQTYLTVYSSLTSWSFVLMFFFLSFGSTFHKIAGNEVPWKLYFLISLNCRISWTDGTDASDLYILYQTREQNKFQVIWSQIKFGYPALAIRENAKCFWRDWLLHNGKGDPLSYNRFSCAAVIKVFIYHQIH